MYFHLSYSKKKKINFVSKSRKPVLCIFHKDKLLPNLNPQLLLSCFNMNVGLDKGLLNLVATRKKCKYVL